MKDLRKHLDAARDEYRAARYPGDLAGQILGRPRGSRNGRWVVASIFAAAAALFITLWLNLPERSRSMDDQRIVESTNGSESIDGETAEQFAFADMPALSVPAIPDEMEFAPVAPEFSPVTPEFSFSVPSFSLLGDATTEQVPSNEEERV